MKIRRVRVENFRGLASADVKLAERGVTVIEAPNESGKSSLVDAVRFVFEHKDRSKRQEVRALQPAGEDVATVAEVELTCGPYHLTCLKQFNKRPRTELHIRAPERAHYTGDEAHDRLQAILSESMDRALFDALWFAQGNPLVQRAFAASPSLSRALDRAAGGGEEIERDDLIEAARKESEIYLTPTGKPRAELQALEARVREAKADLDRTGEELEAVRADVERAESVEKRRRELSRQRAEREPVLADHEERLERIEALRKASREAEAALERARAELARARERREGRETLEQAVADARARLREGEEELARARADLESKAEHLAALAHKRDAAKASAEAAGENRAARARDAAHLEDAARLSELEAVAEAVRKADEEARRADEFLAACELTRARLQAIEAAQEALWRAEAQLEAGGPKATVEALAAGEIAIDGTAEWLSESERREVSASRGATIEFPGVGKVSVEPGTSLDALRAREAEAREALSRALREAGVSSRQEALELDRRRRRAEEVRESRDARLGELLGEMSREELAEAIRARRRRVEGYRSERTEEPALPASLEEARRALAQAEAEEAEMLAASEKASAAHAEVEPAVQAAREALAGLESRRRELEAGVERDVDALERARAEAADDEVREAERRAEEARRAAGERLEEAKEQLAALDPERVELLAQNERAALAKLDEERRALELEKEKLGERLALRGEAGLGEAWEEKRAAWTRHCAERDRIQRKARAARLLYETLHEERERAREAYRAPLVEAIEGVGRIVYGRDFEVALDEELRVASRTLAGRTLAFEQLSSGAKEQLALLVALACARLVGDDGAPLVLDDGLGYTDPERLERMGAVLSEAGRHSQILVLTCVPERYRHVGEGHAVRLAEHVRAGGGEPEEAPAASSEVRRRSPEPARRGSR